MARKSRLGKGLGALFPDLPGETSTPETEPPENTTTNAEVSKDSEKPGSKSAETTASTSQKTDSAAIKAQAAGTITTESTTADSDSSGSSHNGKEFMPKPVNDAKESKSEHSSQANVSRETSKSKKNKRVSIPTLDEMTHPSDMFFGASASRSDKKAAVSDDRKQNRAGETTSQSKTSVQGASQAPSGTASSDATIAHTDQHEDPVELAPVHGGYLAELKLSDVGPNVHQPRTVFDEDELKELADSITEVGVLQPIVVRKRPESQIDAFRAAQNQKTESQAPTQIDNQSADSGSAASVHRRVQHSLSSIANTPAQDRLDSEYELIMGERRWRASQMAGLDTIPAIVKTTADDDMLRDALLENLHRVNLNPLEEAAAYQQMIKEFGLTQAELSHSISKSRPQIANTLRLLNLPGSVQRRVAAGVLSAGHARALLGLSTTEDMDKLATRIIAEGLSVRSTEEIVALKTLSEKQSKKTKQVRSNPWADSPIQHNLENHLDTKVAIKGNQKHGRIEIVFSSPEDMDRIVGLLMPGNATSQSTPNESGWI
jgi:ParB family chromosome partitioning protein